MRDMCGSLNPNFKDAARKVCQRCSAIYFSYAKSRKYCSMECYGKSQPNIEKLAAMSKMPRTPRVKAGRKNVCVVCSISFISAGKTKYCSSHKKEARQAQGKPGPRKIKATKDCLQCGKAFAFSPSQDNRRFCSYQCHLGSGGAFRAGIAARKMTMKYGAKKDANHKVIFDEIRKTCLAHDLSSSGCGVPDGIAWVSGSWQFFDVKNPKTGYGKRGLNPIQKKWANQWQGGPVYLIYTEEEAARFSKGDFTGLKFEGGFKL